jgi:hypothetical protein
MQTWMQLLPDRCSYEIAELARVGFQVDDDATARTGMLVATGQATSPKSGEVDLTIIYPDTFPYLRPEVFAPNLRLERHQNPNEGNLCLLGRSTSEWNVDDTGAWLVSERVPFLLELLDQDEEAMRDAEVAQGEPWLNFVCGEPGAAMFVPEAALSVDSAHTRGRMVISFGAEGPHERVRALLRKVTVAGGRHGQVVAEADEPLTARFGGVAVEGRWVRLANAPEDCTPRGLLGAAVAADPELAAPRWQHAGAVTLDIVGLLVDEEVTQGVYGSGWVFLVRLRQTQRGQRREVVCTVKGERYSAADLDARVPALAGLRDKKVVLIGTGGLGGPIATDLARCGIGGLTLIDGDPVEAGNTVRWPFGLSSVGFPKVNALAGWISQEYPYTDASMIAARLGQVASPSDLNEARMVSEVDVITELFADADLVIDATAELGVQHLISSLAGDLPQLYVWATEGAAGGVVARVRTGTGCWMCLQLHIEHGTLPQPTAIPGAEVQPRGCAHATFVGTSFDLAPVSNQAVRVAVAELLGRSPAEQDVSICSLRDGEEWAPVPQWESRAPAAHPECVACGAARAA